MAGVSCSLSFLLVLVSVSVFTNTQGRRGPPHLYSSSRSRHHFYSTSSHSGSGQRLLSPSSSRSHSYPSSNTGLSGYQLNNGFRSLNHNNPSLQANHGYPSTNTGLSGTNYDSGLNHAYPSSSSALSGNNYDTGENRQYPNSNSRMSGTGRYSGLNNGFPSLISGSLANNYYSGKNHGYPNSNTGMSGTGQHSYQNNGHTSSSSRLSEKNHQGSSSSSGSLSEGNYAIFHDTVVRSDSSSVFNNKLHAISYQSPGGLSGAGNNMFNPIRVVHTYPTSEVPVNKNFNSNIGHSTQYSFENSHNIRNHDGASHSNIYRKEVHHHYPYKYMPPKVVYYTPYEGKSVSYPVFREQPPIYVYQYKSSESKYNNLLAGLALYNLGQASVDHNLLHYHKNYRPENGETCAFGVRYNNGNCEEMSVDCEIITSFIWMDQVIDRQTNANNADVVINTTLVANNQTIYPNISKSTPGVFKLVNGTVSNGTQVPINSSTNLILKPMQLETLVENTKDQSTFATIGISPPITNNHSIINTASLVPYLEMTNISTNKSTDIMSNVSRLSSNGSMDIVNNNSLTVPENINFDHLTMLPESLASSLDKSKGNQIPSSSTIGINNDIVPDNSTLTSMLPVASPLVSQRDCGYTITATEFSHYKGAPIEIKPEMECYVTRITPWSTMHKTVPCELLESYSNQSLFNSAVKPSLNLYAVLAIVMYRILLFY